MNVPQTILTSLQSPSSEFDKDAFVDMFHENMSVDLISENGLLQQDLKGGEVGNEKDLETRRIQFRSCIRVRPLLLSDIEISRHTPMKSKRKKVPTTTEITDYDTEKFLNSEDTIFEERETLNSEANVLILKKNPNKEGRKSLTDGKILEDIFPFDTILNQESNQAKVYEQVAKPMVDDVLDTKSGCRHHVLLSFGISNSGKTHTLIGNNYVPSPKNGKELGASPKRQRKGTPLRGNKGGEWNIHENDGILPRIIHQVLMKSNENCSTNSGQISSLKMSIVHIYKDRIIDLLSKEKKLKHGAHLDDGTTNKNIRMKYNSKTQSFIPSTEPFLIECLCFEDAVNQLKTALQGITVKQTRLNTNGSSRGHTIVTLVFPGDRKITIVDMAGIERVKKSHVIGSALKESIAINENVTAVLNLLRTLKDNNNKNNASNMEEKENESILRNSNLFMHGQKTNKKGTAKHPPHNIVPYRQCALTMMMQPIFSGIETELLPNCISNMEKETHSMNTIVTMLVSVHPGTNDYAEKRALLKQIHTLRGLSVPIATPLPPSEILASAKSTDLESLYPPSPCSTAANQNGGENKTRNESPYWKRVTKKSPLRRIKKRLISTPPKSSAETSKMKHEISSLQNENSMLAHKCSELERRCLHLMEENKDREIKLIAKNKFSSEERYDKKKKQSHVLLPILLEDHINVVRKCNEAYETKMTGGGSSKGDFLLNVPSSWDYKKVCSNTTIFAHPSLGDENNANLNAALQGLATAFQ